MHYIIPTVHYIIPTVLYIISVQYSIPTVYTIPTVEYSIPPVEYSIPPSYQADGEGTSHGVGESLPGLLVGHEGVAHPPPVHWTV